jgi:hypothetical protein
LTFFPPFFAFSHPDLKQAQGHAERDYSYLRAHILDSEARKRHLQAGRPLRELIDEAQQRHAEDDPIKVLSARPSLMTSGLSGLFSPSSSQGHRSADSADENGHQNGYQTPLSPPPSHSRHMTVTVTNASDTFLTDSHSASSSKRTSSAAVITFGGTGGPLTSPSSSLLKHQSSSNALMSSSSSSSSTLLSPSQSQQIMNLNAGDRGGHEWDDAANLSTEQMEEREAKLKAIQHHLRHHQELPLPHDLKGLN